MFRRQVSRRVLCLPAGLTSSAQPCSFFRAASSTSSNPPPSDGALSWYQNTWSSMMNKKNNDPPRSGGDGSGAIGTITVEQVRRDLYAFLSRSKSQEGAPHLLLPEEICTSLWQCYRTLDNSKDRRGQLEFLKLLVTIGVDVEAVKTTIASISKTLQQGEVDSVKLLTQLDRASSKITSLHSKWLQQTSTSMGAHGTQYLLDFRHSLLTLEAWTKKENAASTNAVTVVDSEDLRALQSVLSTTTMHLRDWFQVAWLDMRPLNWNSTAPAVIEEVMKHDHVHKMSTGKLRHALYRMEPSINRRMFAFFHPTIPHMPLVTVQVALTKGICGSVDEILWRERLETPGILSELSEKQLAMKHLEEADESSEASSSSSSSPKDTAIFYSINATQEGLRGIDLGKFLIQKAVQHLKVEGGDLEGDKNIATFSTLSPIPNYVNWLHGLLRSAATEKDDQARLELLKTAFPHPEDSITILQVFGGEKSSENSPSQSEWKQMETAVNLLLKNCTVNPAPAELEEVLTRSAAKYLAEAKRRGRILDPVGNFHVKNGAQLYRINWDANRSPLGLKQSMGMMVNYLYPVQPAEVGEDTTTTTAGGGGRLQTEVNAAAYELKGEVSIGEPVLNLLNC